MSPSPTPSPIPQPTAGAGSAPAVATPGSARAPVPMPSLKPGEVITWIKLERPRLPLGEIIASSFALVGLVLLLALGIGVCLGYLKSKRTAAGAGGLGLR